jgi:hypothetical protein
MLEDVEDIMLKVNDIPIPDFIFTGLRDGSIISGSPQGSVK